MSAVAARDEWNDVLERIHLARAELHCSLSSAWFRGHSSSEWPLLPSRLRRYVLHRLSLSEGDNDPAKPELERSIFRLLEKPYWFRLNLSRDQRKLLERLAQQTIAQKQRIRALQKEISDLKFLEAEVRLALAAAKHTSKLKYDELARMSQKYKFRFVPTTHSTPISKIIKTLDPAAIGSAFDEISTTINRLKYELAERLDQLEQITAIAYGEEDAFTDFNFRWRESLGRSWEVLAMMQHYDVDTRLLDWTECLAIALSFALRGYIELFESEARKSGAAPDLSAFISLCEASGLAEPVVFVLNPYFLARQATGQNKIRDLTLDTELDYYRCFFVRKRWSFKSPLPIYSAWRNERLASQHAMFTVHGTDLRPLEEQAGEDVVKKLIIGRKAAAFGARHLIGLFPLDKFSLFRDLDSLGKTIRDKYMRIQSAAGLSTAAPSS